MLTFAKIALGPLLLLQGRQLRRNSLRLPEVPDGRCGSTGPGVPVLRLLFVGDSTGAGVGVSDAAETLAVQTCQHLAQRWSAPVAW